MPNILVYHNYNKPNYSEIAAITKTFQIHIPSSAFLMQFGFIFNKVNKIALADIAKRNLAMTKKIIH